MKRWLMVGWFCVASFASAKDGSVKASYDVEAAMSFVGKLQRPSGRGMIDATDGDPGQEVETGERRPRTLGLSIVRLTPRWMIGDREGLLLSLRPDALTTRREDGRHEDAREFDSRAGTPYRPAARLHFLDTYELDAGLGSALSLRLGVFDTIAGPRRAYPRILDFGLRTVLPEKLSAAVISWRWNSWSLQDKLREVDTGWDLDVWAFQGPDDRGEYEAPNDDTFDSAPAARDPYMGGAIGLGWEKSRRVSIELLGGFAQYEQFGGVGSETMAAMMATHRSRPLDRELLVCLDARMAKETWAIDGEHIAPLLQESASLTTRWEVGAQWWALAGFHAGRSERHQVESQDNTQPYWGRQTDFGVAYAFSPQSEFDLIVAEERRQTIMADGSQEGGFATESNRQMQIRRLGLEVRYQLDGEAARVAPASLRKE